MKRPLLLTLTLAHALALGACADHITGAAQTQSAIDKGLTWTFSDAGGVEVLTYTGPEFEPLKLTLTCASARLGQVEVAYPLVTAPEGAPKIEMSSGKTKTTALAEVSTRPDGTQVIAATVSARDPVLTDFRKTGALTVGARDIVVNTGAALPEVRKFFEACGG